MAKKYYIDGNLIAAPGSLFARDVSAGELVPPTGAEVIMPKGGKLRLTKDKGSIFDSYFVKGEVAVGGGENGDIYAFKDLYEFTVRNYQDGMSRLRGLLETVIPSEYQLLFYQQQWASCFSLLESFLSNTFTRETCDREDAYHRVWNSGCLDRVIRGEQQKSIAQDPDCLEKELLYIELANKLIYHNHKHVRNLFRIAFDIDVDLSSLEDEIQKRHDIVHRNGFGKNGETVLVTHDDVGALLTRIDAIVQHVIEQITKLPPSE